MHENVNSITGRNILNIYIETGLHPLLVSARDIRTRLELRLLELLAAGQVSGHQEESS